MSKKDKVEMLPLSGIMHIDSADKIFNIWLCNTEVLSFLSTWEIQNNPSFDQREAFDVFKETENHTSNITLDSWLERTGAIGFRREKNEIYAGMDIAFRLEEWVMENGLLPELPDMEFDELLKKLLNQHRKE